MFELIEVEGTMKEDIKTLNKRNVFKQEYIFYEGLDYNELQEQQQKLIELEVEDYMFNPRRQIKDNDLVV